MKDVFYSKPIYIESEDTLKKSDGMCNLQQTISYVSNTCQNKQYQTRSKMWKGQTNCASWKSIEKWKNTNCNKTCF